MVKTWDALFSTNAEYWEEILRTPMDPRVPELPVWIYESNLFEEGVMTTLGEPVRKWSPYPGYVPLREKIQTAVGLGWQHPPSWENGMPDALTRALVTANPPGTARKEGPHGGERKGNTCPRGAGWYLVVMLRFNRNSRICTDTGALHGIICKEQLLNPWSREIECWGSGAAAVSYRPAMDEEEADWQRYLQEEEERDFEAKTRRVGVWASADMEEERLVHNTDILSSGDERPAWPSPSRSGSGSASASGGTPDRLPTMGARDRRRASED